MDSVTSPFYRSGTLIIISAPSGAGKTTVCTEARKIPGLVYSVSCTTRAPRPGEVDGKDYHFRSREAFQILIEEGAFLEFAEVHGNFYGTLRSEVVRFLEQGIDVLLDVDIQGAETIRQSKDAFILDSMADVFLMPPSLEELRKRLEGRGSESKEQIELRLRNASREIDSWRKYRYAIVSGTREEDAQRFCSIILAERSVSKRMLVKK